MRVLICAGRFYADIHSVTRVLDLYHQSTAISVVIHGGHQSLGGVIEGWARENSAHVVRYPANWSLYGKYAEIRRNLFMFEDSQPELLLAFPGGEDTAECIKLARNAGVNVIEVEI